MAASEGFIPYITDPLGHPGLIMESKTFAKMDGKMWKMKKLPHTANIVIH